MVDVDGNRMLDMFSHIASLPIGQGLTLVHFSAQRKRFLWVGGNIHELFRDCLGVFEGYQGMFRVYFV